MSASGGSPSPKRRVIASSTALLLAAAGPTLIGFTGAVGPFWALMLFGGIALILIAITIQVIQIHNESTHRKTIDEERISLRREIRDALLPIPELIAQLPALSLNDRTLRLQGIAQACATALYMLVSPHSPEVRANVFTLEENPDRMVWLAHVGRGETPRVFESGTPRGDAALKFITELQPAYYADLSRKRPVGYEGSMSGYKTFISSPMWSGDSVYGMVTIDSPERRTLTKGDQFLLELVAELMATAFEVANTEPPPALSPGSS